MVKEFKKEYWQDTEDVRQQEREERTFRKGELLGQFTAKKLSGWSDKWYDEEYWGRLEKNWRQWKGGWARERRTLEIIWEEKEEIKQKESEIRECIEEDEEEIGNIVDLNYEL